MSKPTRIAHVGATGLIGMSLIRLAVSRPDIRIIAIARREVALPPGARMEVLVADPENWGHAIAILAEESTPETKATVFGFHRSMDTFGAMLGPAMALVYLYFYPQQYKMLFILALFPGIIALGPSPLSAFQFSASQLFPSQLLGQQDFLVE